MAFIRYFFLLAFLVINSLLRAEITNGNTPRALHLKTHGDSLKLYDIRTLPDSIELRDKILKEYERLEAYNKANDREGKTDQNIYVIDPLEDGVYVKILSNNPEDNLTQRPSLKALNERLKEFNNSRKGKDENSEEDKDNTVLFVVACFGLEAYLNSNDAPAEGPSAITKSTSKLNYHLGDDATLNAYFEKEQKEKILDYIGSLQETIKSVNEALAKSGYRNRMIYSYASLTYYTPGLNTLDRKKFFYTTTDILIESDDLATGNGEYTQTPLKEKRNTIINKARQKKISMKGKGQGAYIRESVEQLILAYQEVMDNDKVTLDKDKTDCDAPKNCWPMTDHEYKTALERFAAKSSSIGQIPNLKVDKIENFEGTQRTKSLTDGERAFIMKQLPDLLTFTESEYSVLIRFAEIDCEIPENERQKFAQDVYKHLSYDPMTILIAVPYYACREQVYDVGGSTHLEVSALHFMPAVYTANAELNVKMNAAFRDKAELSDALLNALTPVPKKNTTYVGHVLYTGQITFQVKEHENYTGTPNRVDVFVFIDDRAIKLQPWLDLEYAGMRCEDVLNSAVSKRDGSRGIFTKCMEERTAGINNVLSTTTLKWNILTSKEGKKYSCDLKQSELMKEDGATLAQQFVWAAIHKADLKFYSAGKLGTIDYNGMPDNLFYGENPFHETHWAIKTIETGLDAGSFVASFVGLDFVFDAASAGFYIIVGDKTNAAIAAGSIIVPAALITGVKAVRRLKGMKAAHQLSNDLAKSLVEGKSVLVNVAAGQGAMPVTIAMDLIKMPNGADHLLVVMGTVMEPAALKILDSNQQLRNALEESFYIVKDSKVVPNPELPVSELSLVKDMANDAGTLELYGKALKTNPNLKFYNFITDLKKIPYNFHLSPSVVQWSANLKQEPGWVNLVVDGIVDGKIVNNAGEPISDAAVVDFLIQNGYLNGYPDPRHIRIIVKDPAKNTGADLAAIRLGKKIKADTKSHAGEVEIAADGLVKMKDGTDVKWVVRSGKLPTPDQMFPGFAPGSNVVDESRVFQFMPYELSGESVVCMIEGKLTVYTPDQIVELFKQKNLRGDAIISIGFPNNSYYYDNYDDIQLLTKDLQEKLPNRIEYPHKDGQFYMDENGSYRKFMTPEEQEALNGIPGGVENLKTNLVALPEKHPFLLFTEKNHTVNAAIAGNADENRNTLFLVVEEITKDGKIRVHHTHQILELSPEDFSRILKLNGVEKKNLNIVAGSGSPESIRKFVTEMAQQTKVEVKAGVADLKAVEDITTQGINFMKQSPMGDGLYHLRQNITDEKFWKKLTDPDEFNPKFVEEFGKQVKTQNFGKYATKFNEKDYERWVLSIYEDFKQTGKVSLPTHEYLREAIALLQTEPIPNPWEKFYDLCDAAYKNNVSFSKNLAAQLKSLDPEARALLRADKGDMVARAITFYTEQTVKKGHGLRYFMALEGMNKKLPDDMVKAIVDRFPDDELFVIFMSKELDKFGIGPTLDKFKLYQQDPDFLDEFKALHKAHLENPNRVVDLPLHTLQYQAKNQISFVGKSDNTFHELTDKLMPQVGYMDVFVRMNSTDFIDETGKVLTPKQVAELIKKNPHWDGRPLRFLAKSENVATDTKARVQWVIDELNVDGKINPKNDLTLTNEGKLVSRWDDLHPAPTGRNNNSSSQLVFADAGDLQKLARELPQKEGYFDFFSSVNAESFTYRFAGGNTEKFNPERVANILKNNPAYKENTPLRFILEGDEEAAVKLNGPLQKLINRMNVVAEVYHPHGGTKMYPTMAILGDDGASIQNSRLLRQIENQLDAVVHGRDGKSLVRIDADGTSTAISSDQFVDWLLKEPAFAETIRDGKPFSMRLFSCSASEGDVALEISAALTRKGINIDLIAPNVRVAVLDNGQIITDNIKGGYWFKYSAGKLVGKVGDAIAYVK